MNTCANSECCTQIGEGSRSKYCSARCRERAKYLLLKADPERYAAMVARVNARYRRVNPEPRKRTAPAQCSQDGCDRVSKTRGLCATHYNRAYQPNRHKKVPIACDCCGALALKSPTEKRWPSTYCSLLCRDYAKYGPLSQPLPYRHPATGYVRKEASRFTPSEKECGWCGDAFQTVHPRSRFCSKSCLKRSKRVARRGREAGAHGTYTWSEVVKLWIKFDKRCAYCRKATALNDIQAEHVVPLSKGGANNTTNLLPSCGPCNADKRDLLLHEWAQDRATRQKSEVITSWHHADPLYSHLTSTLELVA